MQTIRSYFIPCTNFRPSRVKAVCEAGSVTLSWDHDENIEGNHTSAVRALCKKLDWHGTLAFGSLRDGTQTWVFVKDFTTIEV